MDGKRPVFRCSGKSKSLVTTSLITRISEFFWWANDVEFFLGEAKRWREFFRWLFSRFEMSENTLQVGKQKCLAKNVRIILPEPNMSWFWLERSVMRTRHRATKALRAAKWLPFWQFRLATSCMTAPCPATPALAFKQVGCNQAGDSAQVLSIDRLILLQIKDQVWFAFVKLVQDWWWVEKRPVFDAVNHHELGRKISEFFWRANVGTIRIMAAGITERCDESVQFQLLVSGGMDRRLI